MKSKEEEILKNRPDTLFCLDDVKRDTNKPKDYYTNAWGLIMIPLAIAIAIGYTLFKVLL